MLKCRLFLVAAVMTVVATVCFVRPSDAQQNDNPVVRMLMFSSATCTECQAVKRGVLADLKDMYGQTLEIKDLDIDNIDNAEMLFRLEDQFGVSTSSTPVIFVGGHVLSGQKQCEAELADTVALVLAEGGSDYPTVKEPAPAQTQNTSAPDAPVYMAYFYERGCPHCNLADKLIGLLQKKHPNLNVRKFDMDERDAKLVNEAICTDRKVPEDRHMLTPSVVLGRHVLVKDEVSLENIETVLASGDPALSTPPWEVSDQKLKDAESKVMNRVLHYRIAVVAGAGLLDGLNPCAFATLIFFISYLTMIGRKGKTILAVGAAFAVSVFTTYLLIGFGFFEFLHAIEHTLRIVALAFYTLTALAAFVLAGFTFRDYLLCRRGALADITLQLPKWLKNRIHRTISVKSRTSRFVLGAATAGFIVSLLELACTGQVYLPTIALVAQTTGFRSRAAILLIFYNLMFILPLVVVFAVTYMGVSSKRLTEFFQQKAAAVKLATAVLFVAMGVFLILQVFKTYV